MNEAFDPPFASIFRSNSLSAEEDEFRSIWDDGTMLRLAKRLYERPDRERLHRKLRTLRNRTQAVEELLRACIDVESPSEFLLFAYWYEFKQVREDFCDRYAKALRLFETNKRDAPRALFDSLSSDDRFDVELARSSLKDAVHRLIEGQRVCAICMNSVCDACLIHKNRGCSICRKCAESFEEGRACPFCRETVERVVVTN